jgi:hypothetical protein
LTIAEYRKGRAIVASELTNTCFELTDNFLQEIASLGLAPLRLPSYSVAVVMYTAYSRPSPLNCPTIRHDA